MADWWDDLNNVGHFENPVESYLFDNLSDDADISERMADDETLKYFFDAAWFDTDISADERYAARELLDEYLDAEYDLDIDEEMDWEVWRAWYDAA